MNLYQNNITREEIDQLEVRQFGGLIHVVSDKDEAAEAVDYLRTQPVLGFDTETRPNFRKGNANRVALLQLAAPEEVFLFRINRIGLTHELICLFEDENILKTGVAVRDDLRKLRSLKDFNPAGFLELQEYTGFYNIESNGLKKLAAIVLGIKISKSQQLSDWEARSLTEAQQRYAATDAWVSLEIYRVLRKAYSL